MKSIRAFISVNIIFFIFSIYFICNHYFLGLSVRELYRICSIQRIFVSEELVIFVLLFSCLEIGEQCRRESQQKNQRFPTMSPYWAADRRLSRHPLGNIFLDVRKSVQKNQSRSFRDLQKRITYTNYKEHRHIILIILYCIFNHLYLCYVLMAPLKNLL